MLRIGNKRYALAVNAKGTNDHSQLTNRDKENQHPVSAITNLQSSLDGKQNVISDINTIRENASAGKTASETISGYGDIVSHNASEFATSAQGAKADSALQPDDNVSELTNDAGYITGITSSDVTTALGYTPYNSTNPSGYQTASQVSTSISAYHDSTKVDANNAITGGTHTKITYDSKGLITGGSDLSASDIPNLSISKITDIVASATELNYCDGVTSNIQTQLNDKANETDLGTLAYADAITNGDISGTINQDKITNLTTDLAGKQPLLPDQTSQNGKFLTTNGTNLSWATVDALPSQSGQSGKYLTTNGSSASWGTVDALPSQEGHSGSVLTTNGTTASWQGTSECHVVVETYQNGSSWYRLYDDGWVEQGGTINCSANSQANGNLLKTLSNYNSSTFCATDNGSALNGNVYGFQQGCGLSSNSTFYVRTAYDATVQYSWIAMGYSAQ